MTRASTTHRLCACALLLLAGACTQFGQLKPQQPDGTPKPAAPQITESMLRDRAHEQLATGIRQYEAGDFDNALKSLSSSLDHGLLTKAEQATARKNLAFLHCVANREAACRDEFRKAFEIFPEFSLSPAEDGHPIWGPVYRNVRTQLVMEREAAQQRGRPVIPLSHAEQTLADGLVKYSAGDYEGSARVLEAALKEGLPEKADRVRAMKHVAFSYCLREKYRDCRAEFLKIYEVDPAFDLTPAEVGHPSWSKTFAAAKAQAKKNLARKGDKPAAPTPAAVPAKKN